MKDPPPLFFLQNCLGLLAQRLAPVNLFLTEFHPHPSHVHAGAEFGIHIVPERKLCKNVISRSVAMRNLISKQKLEDFSLTPSLHYSAKVAPVFI
jgi:hypothetical protein